VSDVGLLERLMESTEKFPSWSVVRQAVKERRPIHLAVMIEPYLTWILEGKKIIESRFSKNAIAPFRQISVGDLVLLKVTGGPVVGCFAASSVECVTLAKEEFDRIRSEYSEAICADEHFWQMREGKRYATLVGVALARELRPAPVTKSDRRGWITIQPRRHPSPAPQLTLV
jgi:predicted transcriptional regulator